MTVPDIKHEISLTRESLGNRKKGHMALDIVEQKFDELERMYEILAEKAETTATVQTDMAVPAVGFRSSRSAELVEQAKFIEYLSGFDPNNKADVDKTGRELHLQYQGSFQAFNAWLTWASKAVNFSDYGTLGMQWAKLSLVSTSTATNVKSLPEDETPPNG